MQKETFSVNDAGKIEYLYREKKRTSTSVSYHTQNLLQWVIELNIKAKNIKFLEENVGYLDNLGIGKDFVDRTQNALIIKEEKLMN